ncbi:hypothetical protein MMC30_004984 [Trapelia coarctata]|nr:hypothetical protein [Trapelia coarctata]
MDRSLDDLIRFLVEQIALRGEIGALPADILRFLDRYHAKDHRQQAHGLPSTGPSNFNNGLEPKIDRRYQEQVWKWLTKHPEIHVGRNGEGDRMSLTEVEAHNERAQEARKQIEEFQAPTTAGDSVESCLPTNLDGGGNGAILDNSDGTPLPVTPPVPDHPQSVGPPSPKPTVLHVFTSTESMWYAATGHGPDFERVPSKEFVCLSVIASRGAKGILQPDLVRITGQDKRSVPMRTQNLHDKGYIVKKAVITAGSRTSLCTLRRFTLQHSPGSGNNENVPESHTASISEEVAHKIVRESIFGHIEPEIRQVFELLREPKLVTWIDLKRKVGVYMQHSPSRWLARSMRKLEDIGYVQRVRAPGNIRISQRSLHRCIKLIREPREEEWQAFFQMTSDSTQVQQLRNRDGDNSEDDNEEGVEEDYQVDKSVQVDVEEDDISGHEAVKQAQHSLLWTPDRPLINILHDAVQASGRKGVKSAGLKDNVVGFFFNRSLDHQIGRLVELWQASQPLHLRYLAILRDTTIAGKITHYLYYTYDMFKSMVDAGSASWEAVETIQTDQNKSATSSLSIDATPDLDDYGFPRLDPSRFYGHNNNANLAECAAASCVKPFRLTKLDLLVTQAKGTRSNMQTQSGFAHDHSIQAMQLSNASRMLPTMPGIERRGRPPKHFQNNINASKKNSNAKDVAMNATAKRRSREYQRKKAETEVAEWVDKGKDELAARVYVLKKYVHVLEARGVAVATATALEALGFYECASEPEMLLDSLVTTIGFPTDQPMDVMAIWADIFATAESKSGRHPEKRKGRPTKTVSQLGYFPSILAHTSPLPNLPRPQNAKRRSGYGQKKFTSPLGYLPSIAAHTIPSVVMQSRPPRRGRLPSRAVNEPHHPAVTHAQHTAHINYAEHSQNQAPQSQALLGVSSRKRNAESQTTLLLQPPVKRRGRVSNGIPSQLSSPPSPTVDLTQPPNPCIPSQTQRQIQPLTQDTHQEPSLGHSSGFKKPARARKKTARALDGETLNEAVDLVSSQEAQSRLRPYLTYAEQLRAIKRPQTGIFVGPLADLKTKLHRGRPRKSQMVVLKSPNLKNLAWFNDISPQLCKETTASAGTSLHEANETADTIPQNALEQSADGSRAEIPVNQASATVTGTRDEAQLPTDKGSGTSRKRKRVASVESQREHSIREILTTSSVPSLSSFLQQALPIDSGTHDHIPNNARTDIPHAQAPNGTTPRQAPRPSLQEAIVDADDSGTVSKITDVSLAHNGGKQKPRAVESRALRESPSPEQISEIAIHIDGRVDQLSPVENFNTTVETLHQNYSVDNYEQQRTPAGDCNGSSNIRRSSHEAGTAVTPTSSYHSTATETRRLNNDDSLHASDDNLPDDGVTPRELQLWSPKITKVKASGGSVAFMRRNIIMEIVEKSGGVYPGDNQIHRPFCKLWILRTGSGRPESKTIQTALKSLIDSTRLRKLRFTFSNKLGVAVTKSLITLKSIASTDPKVSDTQRKIIDCDPQPYFPDEVDLTSSSDLSHAQSQKQTDPANTARGHRDRLRIVEDTVQLQTFPKNVVQRSRESIQKQKQEKEDRLRRQLEAEMGEPDFAVDGYRPSRATLASEAAGTLEFPLWPGAESVDGKTRRSEFSEPMPKRRRLATLLSSISQGHNNDGSMTRMIQPKGRLMKLIRKVVPAPTPSLGDVFWATRSARVLDGQNKEATASRTHDPPQIRFTKALGIHSNFDRTPSPDPGDIQWEEDQSTLINQTFNTISPPVQGATLGLQPDQTYPKMRRARRRPLEMQLRSIMRKYQESTPLSRLYRKSARLREKHAPEDTSGSVFNAGSARWQMLSLMDPEHTFHLPSGTFAIGFASQYIPPKRQPMPTKKQRKLAIESARRQISYLMNPNHVFQAPSGTFSVEFAVLSELPSVEADIQPTELLLPDDLEDLLSRPCNTKSVRRRGTFGALEDSIPQQVDCVKMWEIATPELATTKSNEWRFINLQWNGPFEDAPDGDWSPVFEDDQRAREQERRSRQEKGKTQKQLFREMALKASPPNAKRKPIAPEFTTRQLMASKPDVALNSKLLKRDRRVDADGRPLKRVRLRGPQQAIILGPDGDRRIMFAVIVVRTLTGGVEQNIDWVLLTHIFGFEVPERFIHQRWAQLLQRHRLVVDKLQSDFQDMFLQAYEAGTVPPLDYEKLEDYDWNGLIDWASQSIQAPTRSSIPELPTSREKLDDLYEFREVDEKDISDFFEIENNAAVPKRQAVIHRYPHVIPLRASAPRSGGIDKLAIARSWVRANVLTPEETYNSDHARQKLMAIGDIFIENAVRDLLLLKVIMQENKGRLVPGRNYDISEHFLSRFRKKLDIERFRQAMAYKKYLDGLFAANCAVDYSWDASDGEVIVVLNLATHGRIRMVPKDPPSNEFGLNEKGTYRNRSIAKEMFRFTVELEPTASYVQGNPLAPIPPPPGPVTGFVPGVLEPLPGQDVMELDPVPDFARLPAWIDINNDPVPLMWKLSLAAILSIMAARPGVSAKDIEKCLRPSLEVWEIESAMEWCVQAGVGTWTGGSGGEERGTIRLGEWWWMALGDRS